MKVIILAAGQGTRLLPLTEHCPKCMVEYNGKALLHRQLDTLINYGIDRRDIALATGYKREAIVAPMITQYYNKRFASTNMVTTLFSAEQFMNPDEDLIISYGDIIYSDGVLKSLIDTEGDIVIVADSKWHDLWSLRMQNPLEDAETFKMSPKGRIIELGKKLTSLEDAQAQYIGLVRIPAAKIEDFKLHYHSMDRDKKYDGKDFDNMYMTSLLQDLIDNGWNAQAALIRGGWLEIDSVEDIVAYQKSRTLF